MTSKEKRIAQGKEVRKKTDYATFLDVCSDWEDISDSDKKKDNDNKCNLKDVKAPKKDEAKKEPKKGTDNKPEKKSENKSEEKGNKDNERKSEKETKGEDDSTQKEGGQGKRQTAGVARSGESSTTRDTEADTVGASMPTKADRVEEKKTKKSKVEKLNTV